MYVGFRLLRNSPAKISNSSLPCSANNPYIDPENTVRSCQFLTLRPSLMMMMIMMMMMIYIYYVHVIVMVVRFRSPLPHPWKLISIMAGWEVSFEAGLAPSPARPSRSLPPNHQILLHRHPTHQNL